MVFSGTASRYLAAKICAELGCPLGNLTVTTKKAYVDVMYSWFRVPSLTQTT